MKLPSSPTSAGTSAVISPPNLSTSSGWRTWVCRDPRACTSYLITWWITLPRMAASPRMNSLKKLSNLCKKSVACSTGISVKVLSGPAIIFRISSKSVTSFHFVCVTCKEDSRLMDFREKKKVAFQDALKILGLPGSYQQGQAWLRIVMYWRGALHEQMCRLLRVDIRDRHPYQILIAVSKYSTTFHQKYWFEILYTMAILAMYDQRFEHLDCVHKNCRISKILSFSIHTTASHQKGADVVRPQVAMNDNQECRHMWGQIPVVFGDL